MTETPNYKNLIFFTAPFRDRFIDRPTPADVVIAQICPGCGERFIDFSEMLMNANEIKEQLLAMGAAPVFINGHRVDRFYLDCFIVDQAGGGYDLEQSVDVDSATQLILAANHMVNGE